LIPYQEAAIKMLATFRQLNCNQIDPSLQLTWE